MNNTQDTKGLLEFIYKNAGMGAITIPKLLEKCTDSTMQQRLRAKLNEYEAICQEAQQQLLDLTGETPEGIGAWQETSTDFMTSMKLMNDTSPTHLADMMIQGSTMGIADITKQMNRYVSADNKAVTLAERLKKTEQTDMADMAKFLGR